MAPHNAAAWCAWRPAHLASAAAWHGGSSFVPMTGACYRQQDKKLKQASGKNDALLYGTIILYHLISFFIVRRRGGYLAVPLCSVQSSYVVSGR